MVTNAKTESRESTKSSVSVYKFIKFRKRFGKGSVFLFLFALLFADFPIRGSLLGESLYFTGLALLFIAFLGRLWAILYSGGRKNKELVTTGPYSIMRHPLYSFSMVAAIGFGLLFQSLVVSCLLLLSSWILWTASVSREERLLHELFPRDYEEFSAHTPRFFPNFNKFHDVEKVEVHTAQMFQNARDNAVIFMLPPLVAAHSYLQEFFNLSHFVKLY